MFEIKIMQPQLDISSSSIKQKTLIFFERNYNNTYFLRLILHVLKILNVYISYTDNVHA